MESAILSPFGQTEGKLSCRISPCDRNGGTGPWDEKDGNEDLDPFVDSPEELLGREVSFVISIPHLVLNVNVEGGQGCRYEKVYVRYKINHEDEDEEWTTTEPDNSSTFNPKFNFRQKHTIKVDKDTLRRLEKGRMVFQVWGRLCDSKTAAPKVSMTAKKAEAEAAVAAMSAKIEAVREKILAMKECPQCKYDLSQLLEGLDL